MEIILKSQKEFSEIYYILSQLSNNILQLSINNLISIINNTILFCFNNSSDYFYKDNIDQRKVNHNQQFPSIPFIKNPPIKKFTLILDMDETILHNIKVPSGCYFIIRPGVFEFLKQISKFFEIIIFTSSSKSYADFILNKIDLKGNLFSHRLYKSHVIFENGRSVKKLSLIGRDLSKVIFVDNLKYNAKYDKKNLYLISSWKGDIKDKEIYQLKDKLIEIAKDPNFKDDITKGLYISK